MNEMIQKAFEIAQNDLRSCYQEHGIVAGITRLKDYFARNSFFACLGATSLGDFGIVKKNLELFARFQNAEGEIPSAVSKKLKPEFGRGLFSASLDQNALFVVALADYVSASKDKEFAEKHFQSCSKAMEWLKKHERDYLLQEKWQSNWQYSILKTGLVLYTNCCYYKALLDFSALCKELGKNELSESYGKKALEAKQKINRRFWVGNYYADWIDFSTHEYFSADGNVLAVLWGIADEEQAKMIENKIRQHRMNTVPLRNVYPFYPFWRVLWILLPLQAYHYHNGSNWTWLGAANILALKKIRWSQEARAETNALAKLIVENGTVMDVLDNDKPFSSMLLKSEVHFSWSAGLFVKAVLENPGGKH